MSSSTSVRRTILPAVLSSLLFSSSVFAQITANDDGSAGSPFATTDEDTLLDTTGGVSVTSNDTGTFTLLSFDGLSAQNGVVSVNTDGTFSYDPGFSGAAQALATGATLTDTFGYTLVETPTLVGGVTEELDPTAGINTFPWGALSGPVAATGTGKPDLIDLAYTIPPGGTRNDFGQGGGYNTTSASFEFWLRPDVVIGANQVIIETGGTGTGSAVVINDDATVAFVVRNGTIPIVQSTTTLTAGQWHHIVATYDKDNPGTTDTLSLYIDGGLEGTATATNADNWSGSDDAGLGRANGTTAADNTDVDGDATNETYGNFTGQIGVVRFWSAKVLTPTEVADNRNAVLTAVFDSAVVTVETTGVNDAPGAVDDLLASPTALEDGGPVASTNNLLTNDGPVRYDAATGTTDILLANYDASTSATATDWPNQGSLRASGGDLALTGVTVDSSPVTGRVGITTALDFDDTTGGSGTMAVGAGDGPHDFPGAVDQADASFEFWAKLHADDLTQISTLFETGGGTGVGMVIDNGVLKAGSELDGGSETGSFVSYDLVADSLGLVGNDPTTEFNQYLLALNVGGGLSLYVNGVLVDQTLSGVAADWDGGDAYGLGRFGGANHGGFQNAAATTAYDTFFKGSLAIVRIYGEAFTEGQALQNFKAVNAGTDVEGDSFTLTGILDAGSTLQGIGSPATLASGAIVTLDDATGGFTYDENGAFDFLGAGVSTTDSFTYRIDDGNGGTSDATVEITIFGVNDAVADTLEATETLVTNYAANQIVGNDQHALGTSDAYLNLDANDVTPADVTAGIWRNTGTGGSTFDVTMTGGTLITPPTLESNFGAVGQSWQNPVGTFASFQTISDSDATVEIWFQPTPLTTGRQLLMESGGSVNGMSIVYNADTAEVDFIIDSGTDGTNTIQVSATGIVPGEFNQLIAVYDKDSPTIEDTLTLYLNGDPTAFSAVADATDTNAAGTTDNFSGSDGSGIGAVNASEALATSFGLPGFPATASAPFQGQISIVRVYPRKLSATEFEDNFDAIVQKIDSFTGSAPTPGPGSTITTALGATVTLNADRSFTYDSTGLADIPEGNVVMDSFDYTISDGEGGTTTATVTVNVTGVGSFLAIDDNFGVLESSGPTAFDPRANDSGADSVVVELQSVVSTLGGSIPTGTVNGEVADFLDGGGHGWQYLWNAPTGWTVGGVFDGTTGALGSVADYLPLVWDDTVGGWMADSDGTQDNADAEPGAYLRLSPDGSGIPGLGSTQDGLVGNTLDRCLILAYTVASDGYYVIDGSTLTLGGGTGITVETAVGTTAVTSTPIAGGSSGSFDQSLGFVSADETIYIAICPDGSRVTDFFSGLDFKLVKLPTAGQPLDNILGTVSTDGSTITYDPGSAFNGLAAGQTVDETITYTIRDLTSTLDYDGGTVLFTAGQSLTSSSGGSATIVAVNGDATSGTLRLKDVTGTFADNDTLTGGGGGSALANGTPVASTSVSTASFTVTVTGENDAPTAVDDPLAANADEDTGVTGALSVLLNDTDPDQGDALTLVVSEVQGTAVSGATVVATDKGGSLTMNPNGTFDYDPSGLFNALAVGETDTDTFTYLCKDSGGLVSAVTATATITINGANDPVTATANAYAVDVDATATGNVITDDSGSGVDSSIDTNDVLTVSGTDITLTQGSVSVQADGSLVYDPGCAFDGLAPGATDTDTFDYTLSDGEGETDTATVTITVTGVNRPAEVEDPASLAQVVIGTGTLALGDIVVGDGDATRSLVDTTATALFEFQNGVTVFSDARPDSGATFDLDAGGNPALTDADGMSLDMTFVAQAGDLSGTKVLFDIGGSSNGTSILLVNGIPHLLSKATSTAANAPTDDSGADNVFRDLDWAGDSAVVVPLSTVQVTPGASTKLAVVYATATDTVLYSVNNAAPQTATLLNNDAVEYNGDHSVSIGVDGGGIGGETNAGSGPFRDNTMQSLAGGSAAVSCLRFWSESTGSVGIDLGETVTATLTIQSWNGSDSLSGLTNQGGGVFDVTGDAATVNAALAAMEFVPGGITNYPVTISVSIDDGDEDGGGPVTGSIYIEETVPAIVYVDDNFSGPLFSSIADADGGTPTAPATFGFDAFATLAEAVAAVDPSGTIVVNDGDYSAEGIGLTVSAPNVTLQLTGSGGSPGGSTVIIGSLNASATNAVDIGEEAIVLGNATSTNTIDCPITGTTGTLTKAGADTLQIRAACTFTGQTIIDEGQLDITFVDASNRGSLASSEIVVNSPGILGLAAAVDTTYTHTNRITGTGSVSSFQDGTVIFDTTGVNDFSGGFDLGDGTPSQFDGATGAKQGFVVLNNSGDLGSGKVLSRGGQLQATSAMTIANDIDITGGGFRTGGSNDIVYSGQINPIDGSVRGFGNYGLEGLDLEVSGNIDLTASPMSIEGNNGKDNGTWTFSGDISGDNYFTVKNDFDGGDVFINGTNSYTGVTTLQASTAIVHLNGSHTGGDAYAVQANTTLTGSGSTDAAVTVSSGGTLSPGDGGVGVLSTGSLTLNGTLEIEVNDTTGSGHDQVAVTGALDLTGATLSVLLGATTEVAPSDITVILNDDVDAITGSFVAGVPFTYDYLNSGKIGEVDDAIGGDGNDVDLYAGANSIIGAWRFANYGSSANAGVSANNANGDGDLLVNLLEFAFGTDPNVSDGASLEYDGVTVTPGVPAVFVEFPGGGGVNFKARFLRRDDFGQAGSVSYAVEFSATLDGDWETSAEVPTVVADAGAYDLVEIPYTVFVAGKKARFFRVVVTAL